jgi:hypothetical protein
VPNLLRVMLVSCDETLRARIRTGWPSPRGPPVRAFSTRAALPLVTSPAVAAGRSAFALFAQFLLSLARPSGRPDAFVKKSPKISHNSFLEIINA